MAECSWIHLACHGIQGAANPTDVPIDGLECYFAFHVMPTMQTPYQHQLDPSFRVSCVQLKVLTHVEHTLQWERVRAHCGRNDAGGFKEHAGRGGLKAATFVGVRLLSLGGLNDLCLQQPDVH